VVSAPERAPAAPARAASGLLGNEPLAPAQRLPAARSGEASFEGLAFSEAQAEQAAAHEPAAWHVQDASKLEDKSEDELPLVVGATQSGEMPVVVGRTPSQAPEEKEWPTPDWIVGEPGKK
jgi:hypothetical protein